MDIKSKVEDKFKGINALGLEPKINEVNHRYGDKIEKIESLQQVENKLFLYLINPDKQINETFYIYGQDSLVLTDYINRINNARDSVNKKNILENKKKLLDSDLNQLEQNIKLIKRDLVNLIYIDLTKDEKYINKLNEHSEKLNSLEFIEADKYNLSIDEIEKYFNEIVRTRKKIYLDSTVNNIADQKKFIQKNIALKIEPIRKKLIFLLNELKGTPGDNQPVLQEILNVIENERPDRARVVKEINKYTTLIGGREYTNDDITIVLKDNSSGDYLRIETQSNDKEQIESPKQLLNKLKNNIKEDISNIKKLISLNEKVESIREKVITCEKEISTIESEADIKEEFSIKVSNKTIYLVVNLDGGSIQLMSENNKDIAKELTGTIDTISDYLIPFGIKISRNDISNIANIPRKPLFYLCSNFTKLYIDKKIEEFKFNSNVENNAKNFIENLNKHSKKIEAIKLATNARLNIVNSKTLPTLNDVLDPVRDIVRTSFSQVVNAYDLQFNNDIQVGGDIYEKIDKFETVISVVEPGSHNFYKFPEITRETSLNKSYLEDLKNESAKEMNTRVDDITSVMDIYWKQSIVNEVENKLNEYVPVNVIGTNTQQNKFLKINIVEDVALPADSLKSLLPIDLKNVEYHKGTQWDNFNIKPILGSFKRVSMQIVALVMLALMMTPKGSGDADDKFDLKAMLFRDLSVFGNFIIFMSFIYFMFYIYKRYAKNENSKIDKKIDGLEKIREEVSNNLLKYKIQLFVVLPVLFLLLSYTSGVNLFYWFSFTSIGSPSFDASFLVFFIIFALVFTVYYDQLSTNHEQNFNKSKGICTKDVVSELKKVQKKWTIMLNEHCQRVEDQVILQLFPPIEHYLFNETRKVNQKKLGLQERLQLLAAEIKEVNDSIKVLNKIKSEAEKNLEQIDKSFPTNGEYNG